jgi:hypothetical protein
MLVPNCIFRANGAAILLSNKPRDSWRAKYELKHVVRTTLSNDEAFGCVYQMEDDKGEFGLTARQQRRNGSQQGGGRAAGAVGTGSADCVDVITRGHSNEGCHWDRGLGLLVALLAPPVPLCLLMLHPLMVHSGLRHLR